MQLLLPMDTGGFTFFFWLSSISKTIDCSTITIFLQILPGLLEVHLNILLGVSKV